MSASNELYAHLLEEALKAVRAGVASVEAQSTPNLRVLLRRKPRTSVRGVVTSLKYKFVTRSSNG